jgi:hypothetical protein
MEEEKKLDGQRMNPGAMQALMEILNGGPEIGKLTREQQIEVARPRIKNTGHVLVFSTVADMDKGSGRLLWEDTDKYKLKPFKP